MTDVIAYTLLQSADPYIYENYHSDIIIVEEAAKALEVDCIIALIHYILHFTLLMDDHKQLKPIMLSSSDIKHRENVFTAQLHNSLFSQLKNADHRCPILNENRRMPSEITNLIERLYYHHEKLAFIMTSGKFADVMQRMENFNKTNYKRTDTFIFLNNQFGTAQVKKSWKSVFNAENAAVAINTAIVLLETGVMASGSAIILLTLYYAQYILLLTAIIALHQAHHDLPIKGLAAAKVDSFQGQKHQIVICNLMMTTHSGFVNMMSHLNMALSHTQCEMYIISNMNAVSDNQNYNTRNVQSLMDYCKKNHRHWKIKTLPKSPFIKVNIMEVEIHSADRSTEDAAEAEDNAGQNATWAGDTAGAKGTAWAEDTAETEDAAEAGDSAGAENAADAQDAVWAEDAAEAQGSG